ncbi:IS701 family transposase [Streptomyces sp. NTH33]|uniref:IS701 family transposase n=1 Tax=Streptomyces sp. NTH33 TaxID=1735453 RepID=UPI000DAABF73|nr:IS701 family transposase [Streptomyces sp. NTH33]PZG84382.1 IS701 family transposase [Streptomyces sp. NTH33]
MTPLELAEVRDRLAAFAAEVFAPLGRSDQRRWGERYVRGLLGEGRRKSMEPMAARLGVDRQGLQQFLADSPWPHPMVLAELAWKMEPVIRPAAWVIDDVSFPKDGHASPGVAAQYCGALGKTANCQVAPSVHLVTDAASCPVNWRLFLPEEWDPARAGEPERAARRRLRARIPDDVGHVPKWQLALDMVDELRCWGLDPPLVVADEGYGQDGAFRLALTERGIPYVVGVRSDTAVLPGTAQRIAPPWSGTGRKPVPRYRDRPVSVRELVTGGGRGALHRVTWRTGSKGPLRARFAALRVRPAGVRLRRAYRGEDLPVCWLLAEWPAGEEEPTKYWLSTLPADIPLRRLVRLAKIRWRVEHDYRELKTALGLGDFEGRTYQGFLRHLTLASVAQAFCTLERLSPRAAAAA